MSVPRPGWYPDPSGSPDGFRWWNGSDWTDDLSDDAGAPPPARRPATGGRRTIALVLGLTLVISGGLVGLIGWQTWTEARHGGAAADPTAGRTPQTRTATRTSTARNSATAPSGPDGRLDEVTRTATLAGGRMVLPPAPYQLVGESVTVPGVFDAMFLANAPVHPDQAASDTWAANVGIAHVPADAWSTDDLHRFARRALDGISEQFFGYRPSSVKDAGYHVTTVGSRGCAEITAEVSYAGVKPAGRRDRMRIIGCPEGDGSLVAAISSVPVDAPARLSRLAADSMDTFTIG